MPDDYDAYLLWKVSAQQQIEALKADNAKLRELCADLFKLADESYVPFKNTNKWMNDLVDIESRMRELRIEVPE